MTLSPASLRQDPHPAIVHRVAEPGAQYLKVALAGGERGHEGRQQVGGGEIINFHIDTVI